MTENTSPTVKGGKPKLNRRRTRAGVPATSSESDALSKDLKKREFRFIGSTIIHAFMQAVGMVDDHLNGCFIKPKVQAGDPERNDCCVPNVITGTLTTNMPETNL
ncbi:MAG: hypothetical protein A4E19_13105 [Nitrospira sp. SG-bin1]|nr:MAG: hypothetical protein A4E19_13105 [Nitrospira sp. SG-bin1]